jgi:hypothetical protein
MKTVSRFLSLTGLSLVFVALAAAQGSVDAYVGAGAITGGSNGMAIDTFGTGNFVNTPTLKGATMNLGGEFFVTPHFGIGGELVFRPGKSDYAGLLYRPMFYDVNGIWKPSLKQKRVVPEFQGGIGGVNLRFYVPPSCDSFGGCSSSNTFLESSHHFQVHAGAGVRFYVTRSVFVRPQFDIHWVHNFFQFGGNFVPQYSAVVGYSFGGH